uniref:Uncharacterized protein n=1 Tax=Colobus angolensis palliatus TaxID=336983 RepID=A0A2K5JFU3_COLAP
MPVPGSSEMRLCPQAEDPSMGGGSRQEKEGKQRPISDFLMAYVEGRTENACSVRNLFPVLLKKNRQPFVSQCFCSLCKGPMRAGPGRVPQALLPECAESE